MLTLHVTFLHQSYYLDHDEQDLSCKSRRSFVSDKFGVQANIGEEYAHLRRTEEDLGSEVVFRTDDAWSFEFGPHCFDVAHVHTPLPIQLRSNRLFVLTFFKTWRTEFNRVFRADLL